MCKSSAIVINLDLQAVLDTLVESATKLCEADTAVILRPKGSFYQSVAS
jgi:hypothetical protein